jgi:hypothetical protein
MSPANLPPEGAGPGLPSQTAGPLALEITPALVKEIADRVVRLLLRDLAIERERSRRTANAVARPRWRGRDWLP